MSDTTTGGKGLTRAHWIFALVLSGVAGLGFVALLTKSEYEHPVEHSYVGPGICMACHEEEHESWSKTRMANSFDALRAGVSVEAKKVAGLNPSKDYSRDPECLPCHTTGYGRPGGFVSFEETPDLAGVTCEACHGAGGGYAEEVMAGSDDFSTSSARLSGLVYPPTERVCRGCHNERSPFIGMKYEFDFEKRVSLGTHEHYLLKYRHDGDASAAPK